MISLSSLNTRINNLQNSQSLIAQGPTGPKGSTGSVGPAGPIGAQGLVGKTGSAGPQGPQGLQGAQGQQGLQGLIGHVGAGGIQGPAGVQGPVGLQGLQGIQGVLGSKGDKGDTGSVGATGSTGAQGIQGLKGDVGSVGPQGLKGDIGVGATGATGPAPVLNFIGSWSPSSYVKNTIAISIDDDNTYISKQIITDINTDPASSDQWALFAFSGNDGPAGPTGDQGPAGDMGPVGTVLNFIGGWGPDTYPPNTVAVSQIDNNTYVSLTTTQSQTDPSLDSSEWILFAPSGQPGPAGSNGNDGPIGPTGPVGTQLTFYGLWVANEFQPNTVVVSPLDEKTYISLVAIQNVSVDPSLDQNEWALFVNSTMGTQGPTGVAGPAGPAGNDGKNGKDGKDGKDGVDGKDGAVGPAGNDGAVGPAGNDGAVGPAGNDGAVGPAGPIVPLSSILMNGNDAGGSSIVNVADPTNPQDVATLNSVNSAITNLKANYTQWAGAVDFMSPISTNQLTIGDTNGRTVFGTKQFSIYDYNSEGGPSQLTTFLGYNGYLFQLTSQFYNVNFSLNASGDPNGNSMALNAGTININGMLKAAQPVKLQGADYSSVQLTANASTLEIDGDGATVDNCSMTASGLFMRICIGGTFYRMPLYQDN